MEVLAKDLLAAIDAEHVSLTTTRASPQENAWMAKVVQVSPALVSHRPPYATRVSCRIAEVSDHAEGKEESNNQTASDNFGIQLRGSSQELAPSRAPSMVEAAPAFTISRKETVLFLEACRRKWCS